jgi:transcriptional regulator with XRE-family HTH domain
LNEQYAAGADLTSRRADAMDLRRIVGTNVRFWCKRLGVSQEELAFRAELHRTYVSGVERGIRNPTVVIIGRLAEALEVEPALLLSRSKKNR